MANKRFKIGYVLDDGLDVPNGVQQYILSVGEWMRSRGHDVHYIVGQTTRTDIKNIHSMARNIKVKFNGNVGTMPLPTSTKKIKQFLQLEQFDILHVQMPYSPFFAHKVIQNAPSSTKIIGTFHIAPNSKTVSIANYLLGVWLHSSLKKFNKLLSVSSAAQEFARKTFRIETAISPNVVDYQQFNTAKPFKKYQDGKINILFLGRLVPRKGCQLLLESINQLKHSNNKIRVLICGKGPLLAGLQKYVNDNKLSEIVEFKGFVSEEEKMRYYKTADIAVFPSSGGESFGIVLIEAMSSGKTAILAGDNSGYRAVLHTKSELLFSPLKSSQLTNKLKKMIKDETYRNSIAEWGDKYVRGFDINVVGQELYLIYDSSLQNS